jgi:hypothetical protein
MNKEELIKKLKRNLNERFISDNEYYEGDSLYSNLLSNHPSYNSDLFDNEEEYNKVIEGFDKEFNKLEKKLEKCLEEGVSELLNSFNA